MSKTRYCPGCGKFVVIMKSRNGRPNPKTGWFDHEYIAKCSGCGISARGESANVYALFHLKGTTSGEVSAAVEDALTKAFELGVKSVSDQDYKQPRFDF